MSHPSLAYTIFHSPSVGHVLGLRPTHLINLAVWIGGPLAICVFPGLSQYALLFIWGAAVGQNKHDVLPGERECQPQPDKFIPKFVRVL